MDAPGYSNPLAGNGLPRGDADDRDFGTAFDQWNQTAGTGEAISPLTFDAANRTALQNLKADWSELVSNSVPLDPAHRDPTVNALFEQGTKAMGMAEALTDMEADGLFGPPSGPQNGTGALQARIEAAAAIDNLRKAVLRRSIWNLQPMSFAGLL
jgi:hypothetical protein